MNYAQEGLKKNIIEKKRLFVANFAPRKDDGYREPG